jgi:hypothetical protein
MLTGAVLMSALESPGKGSFRAGGVASPDRRLTIEKQHESDAL